MFENTLFWKPYYFITLVRLAETQSINKQKLIRICFWLVSVEIIILQFINF